MTEKLTIELREALEEAHEACTARPYSTALSIARGYIEAIDKHKIYAKGLSLQLYYILNNLRSWHGEDAQKTKKVLTSYARGEK